MFSRCQGTTSYWNDFVAFKKAVCIYFVIKDVYFRFRFFCSPMFTNKATSFLTTGYALPKSIGPSSGTSKPMTM